MLDSLALESPTPNYLSLDTLGLMYYGIAHA